MLTLALLLMVTYDHSPPYWEGHFAFNDVRAPVSTMVVGECVPVRDRDDRARERFCDAAVAHTQRPGFCVSTGLRATREQCVRVLERNAAWHAAHGRLIFQ